MNALPPTQPTTKSGIDAGLAFHQPMLASPDPQAMLPSERIAATMGDRNLTPKQFGALGEQYAAAWLEEHGWTTLSRNWHTRYGELDIVMLNPEYTVVFVEVKSRRSMHYGYPQEAITPAKQHNLRKAACDWLLDRRNRVPHSAVRFDVVRGHHRSSRHEGFPVAAGSEESGRPRRTHITTRPAPCAPEASV